MTRYDYDRVRPYTGNDPQYMAELEPTSHEWDAARAELGAWASDQQITARAMELAQADVDDANERALADQADSREDWE